MLQTPARSIATILAAALVAIAHGCGALPREKAVPPGAEGRAFVPGLDPGVRTWGGAANPDFMRLLLASVERERDELARQGFTDTLPRADFLAISGGGADGAFGAGMLCAWTDLGTRPEFKAARFAEGVEDIKDLREGMVLEGVVSNVAAFGAFVDIGVHQDGLIHISALSDTFVKDPRDVVKAGDIVKVKVLEVDVARKRIALTRRLEDVPGQATRRPAAAEERGSARRQTGPARPGGAGGRGAGGASGRAGAGAPPANNALADAFARAKRS